MIVYWLMFLVPAAAEAAVFGPVTAKNPQRVLWFLFGLAFTCIIGLRYQVGADWFLYLDQYETISFKSLEEATEHGDLGYSMLNWGASRMGFPIYFVNCVCGAIFMWGVCTFARQQPRPWLAILVAVPYLIIVVAMGYTRQAAAIGFALLALVALSDKRLWRFLFYMILGALFHKTVIVLFPIVILVTRRNRLWTIVWAGIAGAGLYIEVMAEHYEFLIFAYIQHDKKSAGAGIRVAMNAIPAILLLIFRKKLAPEENARRVWCWVAILCMICVPLLSITSTTAVDRVALYFLPIQMFVFSRIHYLFDKQLYKLAAVAGVILYHGTVQWVWLNLAIHARYWVPYRMFPWGEG